MNLEQQFNTAFDQFPTTDILVHNRYGMHYWYHYNDLTNKNKTQLKTYYC